MVARINKPCMAERQSAEDDVLGLSKLISSIWKLGDQFCWRDLPSGCSFRVMNQMDILEDAGLIRRITRDEVWGQDTIWRKSCCVDALEAFGMVIDFLRRSSKPTACSCRIRVTPEATYITPTDEDAKRRPMVQVRDTDLDRWKTLTLLTVLHTRKYPFYCLENNDIIGYKQCRMKVEA